MIYVDLSRQIYSNLYDIQVFLRLTPPRPTGRSQDYIDTCCSLFIIHVRRIYESFKVSQYTSYSRVCSSTARVLVLRVLRLVQYRPHNDCKYFEYEQCKTPSISSTRSTRAEILPLAIGTGDTLDTIKQYGTGPTTVQVDYRVTRSLTMWRYV